MDWSWEASHCGKAHDDVVGVLKHNDPLQDISPEVVLDVVAEERAYRMSIPDTGHLQGNFGQEHGGNDDPTAHNTRDLATPESVLHCTTAPISGSDKPKSSQNKENGLLRIRRTGNTIVFPVPVLSLTSAGSLACVRFSVSGGSRRKPRDCAVCSVNPLPDLAQRRLGQPK